LLVIILRYLRSPLARTSVIATIAAASLLHSQLSASVSPEYAFYWLFPRAFELLTGCGLAVALDNRKALPPVPFLAELGALLVIASAMLLNAGLPLPGFAAMPACCGTAFCIYAGLASRSPAVQFLGAPPVVLAGKISYSLYLYHWPLLALAHYWIGAAPDTLQSLTLLSAAVVAAFASWLLVENRLTHAFDAASNPWRLLRFAAATSITLGLFCGLIVKGAGWPWRFDDAAAAVYANASEKNPNRSGCDGYQNVLVHNETCSFGLSSGTGGPPLDFAIFGDSNADQFVPMLTLLAEKAHLRGRQITQSSCAILIGAKVMRPDYIERECLLYQEQVLKFIDANPHLKFAILSSSWSGYQKDTQFNSLGEKLGMGRAGGPATFDILIERTIGAFRSRGIPVIIFGQIPYPSHFAIPCYVGAARAKAFDTQCVDTRVAREKELQISQQKFRSLAVPGSGIDFVDMVDLICSKNVCSTFKDGVFLYHDRGHLNGVGSRYLANYVKLPH